MCNRNVDMFYKKDTELKENKEQNIITRFINKFKKKSKPLDKDLQKIINDNMNKLW